MSQADVVEMLKRFPDQWFRSTELAGMQGYTVGSMNRRLCKLRKYKMVSFMEVSCAKTKPHFIYKFKDGGRKEWE